MDAINSRCAIAMGLADERPTVLQRKDTQRAVLTRLPYLPWGLSHDEHTQTHYEFEWVGVASIASIALAMRRSPAHCCDEMRPADRHDASVSAML